MTDEYDVIVLGAGPAGDFAAALAVEQGLTVGLIERERVGGECAYWACMPSKALLRPAELLAEMRRVPGTPDGSLDVPAILARRDEATDGGSDAGHAQRQEGRGIHVLRGHGRLNGERVVTLQSGDDDDRKVLTAGRAVIVAVGSGPKMPSTPGLADAAVWTNREATTASAVPDSLIILGGGVVGVEMAQAWSSLGSAVTLIQADARLLPDLEPFASELVTAELVRRGVSVRLDCEAETVTREKNGTIEVCLSSGDTVTGAELLVAIGRQPQTDDLGLETVDLTPGELIDVNDRMRVPGHGDWLYAIGDVNGRALLTHAGKYQAMIAVANIMGREAHAQWDGALTPQVVFAEPQVAAVGLTLDAALDAGVRARAVDDDLGATPGASFVGRGASSAARIVVDTDREVIIGATFAGPDVAEFLQAATIAMVGEVPLSVLAQAIPAYPTRSETWLGLLADWRP